MFVELNYFGKLHLIEINFEDAQDQFELPFLGKVYYS